MLRRAGLAMAAWTVVVLSGPPSSAQGVHIPRRQPAVVESSLIEAHPAAGEEAPVVGAVEDLSGTGGIAPVVHSTDCSFPDPIAYHDECCCRGPRSEKLSRFKQAIFGNGGDNSACGEYGCADCYGKWDIEKRVFFSYVHGNAHKPATRASVNDLDGGQIGAEFLPFVLQDGSEVFTRWGFTVMWQYSRFLGSAQDWTVQSRLSGGTISIDDGDMYSLVIGPTYRMDFDLFGIRFSPNSTVGATFDWVDLNRGPVFANTSVRTVEQFNFTGFDAGFYSRWMFDIGITERLNFSIGMDFRASDTDVMQEDSLRKHLGFVIGMSHTF